MKRYTVKEGEQQEMTRKMQEGSFFVIEGATASATACDKVVVMI
jgi:hypothetical protein